MEHLQKILDSGQPLEPDIISKTAENGDLQLLKFLYRAKIDHTAVDNAAKNGHLECVKYLVINGAPIEDSSIDFACAAGHLDIVKFLYNYLKKFTFENLDNSIKSGNFELFKFVYTSGAPRSRYTSCSDADEIFLTAATAKNTAVIKFLIDNKLDLGSPSPIFAAAFSGNLEIMQLLENYYKDKDRYYNYHLLSNAIKGGHMEILTALKPMFGSVPDIVKIAAKENNIDIVKYLVENGANIDYSTEISAENNNIEMLKYLINSKFPVYSRTIYIAIKNGNLELIKYLVSFGIIMRSEDFTTASEYGQLEILKFLKNRDLEI